MREFSKVEKIIIVISILITLLEVSFQIKAFKDYKGVYEITLLTPILMQPFIYYRLFKNKVYHYKLKLIIMGLISFAVPLTIFLTLPQYTYDEGKQMLQQYLGQKENAILIDSSSGKYLAPVTGNRKHLFLQDAYYYYEVTSDGEKNGYIVSPTSGKVTKLQDTWAIP